MFSKPQRRFYCIEFLDLPLFRMDRIPKKCPSNVEEEDVVTKKKLLKLENKVKSITDRSKDSCNNQKAYDHVTTELKLFRSFALMILSLFKNDDLAKLEKEPSQCGSQCRLKAVKSMALMIRDMFIDDEFLTCKMLFLIYVI